MYFIGKAHSSLASDNWFSSTVSEIYPVLPKVEFETYESAENAANEIRCEIAISLLGFNQYIGVCEYDENRKEYFWSN